MPFDPARRIHRLRLSILSSEQIRAVSSGEITSPDTINHKTLLPEPGGLFCQRIFGPLTDLTCACGRRRTDESEPILCQRCGVERIESTARRTRFGHIPLAAPVCHIWRYRGSGNQITLLTGIPPKNLDKIVHHAADIVVHADLRATERIARNLTDKGERDIARLIERTRVGDAMTPEAARALESAAQGAIQMDTGATAIRRILSDLDIEAQLQTAHEQLAEEDGPQREKTIRKIRLIEDIIVSGSDITDMITDTVLVLPPSLRPMMQMDSGRFASSDLNDLYRKVINRNNRLRRFLAMNTPDVILRNERRLLQNAVDTLFDNSGAAQPALGLSDRPLRSVSDQLRGKKGRFRQNLLGKRVDYSGRSVIVSGPDLNLGQCGLPYDMAAELFRPHLIRRLIARTPLSSKHSAMALSKKTHLPIVREALDELAAERLIILNRAPTLHRLSMQAFHPVLSDDKVIRLHPLSCGGFNADFDGDQMAVHAPLSREALEEAKERMRGSLNTVSPADGSPSALPSLDIILGLYYLTILDPQAAPGPGRVHHFPEPETAERAHAAGALALRAPITADGIEGTTSVGRIIFNRALPEDTPFQNTDADKKLIGRIVLDMYESDHYGPARIARTLDALKNLGFRYAFLSGLSIGVSDMITPPGKPDAVAHAEGQAAEIAEAHLSGLIDDEERHEHITRIWQQTSDEVKAMVEEIFPELGDLHLMATSGAKGNIDNIRQMVGMRGLMSDPSGRTIERPVKSHFAEGLGVFEYFISTHGARKGLADTALRTSDAGYLTRRLVDATHHIYVSTHDCGTDEGLMRTPQEEDFAEGVARRLLAQDASMSDGTTLKRGTRISPTLAQRLADDPAISYITVRTPLRCRAAIGICAACYGDSLTDLLPARPGLAAGVIAAQSIGEPGTQLTMRTFHRGGVAGDDITNGLPRVEEILEARRPALLAAICRETGTVFSVSQSEINVQSLRDGSMQSYGKRWPNARFLHTPGDYVEAGSALTTGSGHLAEILEVGSPEMAWKYAVSEIQAVYRSQGVDIHDKHIEIILSAMFAFCATTDPGDTGLLEGETARKTRLTALNEEAERDGRRPARAVPMVMGITRSAILAEGFLSSASFQRTIQALADASLARAEDRLSGLKENVIVGQLIPTATLPAAR